MKMKMKMKMNSKYTRLVCTALLLAMPQLAAAGTAREFHYINGQCLNAQGETGFNPVSTIEVSAPLIKDVSVHFGFAPGVFTYFESVDAECTDLSEVADFSAEILKAGVPRIWIQTLNFKGVKGPQLFNDFDTPRAMLEGATLPKSFKVYASIAATIDEHTFIGKNPATKACYDIKLKKGIWLDEIVDPNNAFCSTNTWP